MTCITLVRSASYLNQFYEIIICNDKVITIIMKILDCGYVIKRNRVLKETFELLSKLTQTVAVKIQ